MPSVPDAFETWLSFRILLLYCPWHSASWPHPTRYSPTLSKRALIRPAIYLISVLYLIFPSSFRDRYSSFTPYSLVKTRLDRPNTYKASHEHNSSPSEFPFTRPLWCKFDDGDFSFFVGGVSWYFPSTQSIMGPKTSAVSYLHYLPKHSSEGCFDEVIDWLTRPLLRGCSVPWLFKRPCLLMVCLFICFPYPSSIHPPHFSPYLSGCSVKIVGWRDQTTTPDQDTERLGKSSRSKPTCSKLDSGTPVLPSSMSMMISAIPQNLSERNIILTRFFQTLRYWDQPCR